MFPVICSYTLLAAKADVVSASAANRWVGDRLPIRTVRLGNVGCQVSVNHAYVVANTTHVDP